jgi:hypothetical protein
VNVGGRGTRLQGVFSLDFAVQSLVQKLTREIGAHDKALPLFKASVLKLTSFFLGCCLMKDSGVNFGSDLLCLRHCPGVGR